MVMLNNFLAKAALGFLSVASSASAFNLERRYANSTSCETQTQTSTSVVSVYGSPYTGVPSNEYTTPTAIGSWSDSEVIFDVYVPQSIYDLAGLDLILESVTGGSLSLESFVLYSGDIDHFVYPGSIYSSSNDGLVLDGRTQDPLLKISVKGSHAAEVDIFVASFVLELDVIPSGALVKRDVVVYSLEATASKSVSDVTSTSSSTTSTSGAPGTSTEGETSTTSGVPTATDGETSTTSGAPGAATDGETSTTSGAPGTSTEGETSTTSGAPGAATEGETSITSGVPTATDGETVVLSNGETVVIGSTVTQTITSCSDNKCSEATRTAVGSVVVETVDEVVTSFTTYCPIAVDVPQAKTYVSINKTVTVGSTVVVIDTFCPVTNGKVEKTITATDDNTIVSTIVTLTEFVPVTKLPTSVPVPTSATINTLPSVTPTGTTINTLFSVTPTGTAQETSTSEGADHTTVSVYNGGAVRSSISGGIVGIFALAMML